MATPAANLTGPGLSASSLDSIRLIDLGCADYRQTQAAYHAVAEAMGAESPDTILLAHPGRPYLCLGYHDIYSAVLDRGQCRRLGLPVLRRRVGGGTTYLDGNQLFYQCVFHHSRVPAATPALYAHLLAGPVAALRGLGLNAALRAVNELEVEGRRIAGIGGGRIGEAAVVVGNILFDFDYAAMGRVWRVPWPEFGELARKALSERITTLGCLLGAVSIERVRALLVDAYGQTLGRPLVPGNLTSEEMQRAAALAEQLGSQDFLHLHDERTDGPMRVLKIAGETFIRGAEAQAAGRNIRATFRLRGQIIEEARITSRPAASWKKAERALCGVDFKDWLAALPMPS